MDKGHKFRLILYISFTLLTMCAIFLFSSQSGDDSQYISDSFLASVRELIELLPPLTGEGAASDVRKYAHMFEFFTLGVFSFLMFAEFLLKKERRYSASALFSYIFCCLYAASDELHQRFIPERSAQFSDVLTDSVGFTAGIMLVLAISLIFCRKEGENG